LTSKAASAKSTSNISRRHAGETSVGVGAGAAPFAIFKGCGFRLLCNPNVNDQGLFDFDSFLILGAAPFAILKGCGFWIANNISERSEQNSTGC
jgi:hypothetical protein